MPAGGRWAAVMIQIGLGGWLTCRLWDGIRSLGTVWRIGRSPMEYSMEHSVSRTVVVSECSPPPMCGLGRSEGDLADRTLHSCQGWFVPDRSHGFVPMNPR